MSVDPVTGNKSRYKVGMARVCVQGCKARMQGNPRGLHSCILASFHPIETAGQYFKDARRHLPRNGCILALHP